MFQLNFVDREKEMEFLERFYRKNGAQMLVIYGRRRVGKTELIKQFVKDKPHVYFLADQRGDIQNLTELKGLVADYIKNPLLKKADIKDWIELFNEFSKSIYKKTILVIDEFPALIESNKAIPSIFQKLWDTNLSKTAIILILTGSSIGMMETDVLGYQSPLYGRRTGQWMLEPLRFRDISEFFPGYDFQDIIKCYAALDGIPLYLLKFDKSLTFEDNIKQKIFTRGEYLYQEAEILLRQELREPANYFNILKAVSFGRQKFGEIARFSNIDHSLLSKYLDNLIKLKILKKEFPITENRETRNAHYIFSDNYYMFWFRYVYPNKSMIEEDMQEGLLKKIKDDTNIYYALIFENVCHQFLMEQNPKLLQEFTKIGRWWHKDKEIDIVALNETKKEILFAECKWQANVNAENIFLELKEKAKHVDWNNNNREEHFAIFAKSFSKRADGCFLFDFKDMEKVFKGAR